MLSTVFEHDRVVSSTQKNFRARDGVECSNVFLSAGNSPGVDDNVLDVQAWPREEGDDAPDQVRGRSRARFSEARGKSHYFLFFSDLVRGKSEASC